MCLVFGTVDFNNRNNTDLMMPLPELNPKPGKLKIYITNNAIFQCQSSCDCAVGKPCLMTPALGERIYTVLLGGEIYNAEEVREKLRERGAVFRSECVAEVLLYSYIIFGEYCVRELNGEFVFCIYDEKAESLFAACDTSGAKKLFYTVAETAFVFSSDYDVIKTYLEIRGRTSEKYRIKEIEKGQCGRFCRRGFDFY